MHMAEEMAVPGLPGQTLKDQISQLAAGGALEPGRIVAGPQVKTAGRQGSQNHVGLNGLVAFGGLKEFQ